MAKFKVAMEFDLLTFEDVEIEAKDSDEAHDKALAEYTRLYPEALEITVVSVTEI